MEQDAASVEEVEVGHEATEQFTVRFTCRALSEMRKLAHQHNRTPSQEIRHAVALYLAQYKKRAGA